MRGADDFHLLDIIVVLVHQMQLKLDLLPVILCLLHELVEVYFVPIPNQKLWFGLNLAMVPPSYRNVIGPSFMKRLTVKKHHTWLHFVDMQLCLGS